MMEGDICHLSQESGETLHAVCRGFGSYALYDQKEYNAQRAVEQRCTERTARERAELEEEVRSMLSEEDPVAALVDWFLNHLEWS